MAARNNADDVTVCGFVNAKNSYGGYTDSQPFYGLLQERKGEPYLYTAIGIGSNDVELEAVKQ